MVATAGKHPARIESYAALTDSARDSRLASDPEYNAQLGSSYLAAQLQAYNGSLLLAAAAYNAGAGNANKWIAAFGDPRQADVDPVVWVELIPFQETRRYTKRVLASRATYAFLYAPDQASAALRLPLQLALPARVAK